MIKINLLPVKEAKKRTTIQNQLVVAVIVLLVVLAGIINIAIMRKREISELNRQLIAKQGELKRLQEVSKKVEQFKKDNENLNQKIGIIRGLEGGRDWYLQVLDQLSQVQPKEVWIDELKTPSSKESASGIWEIKGGAMEKDQISNFMSNLEKKSDYFGVISLKKVERAKVAQEWGMPFYKYEMSVQVKRPPQAEQTAQGKEG